MGGGGCRGLGQRGISIEHYSGGQEEGGSRPGGGGAGLCTSRDVQRCGWIVRRLAVSQLVRRPSLQVSQLLLAAHRWMSAHGEAVGLQQEPAGLRL